MTEIETTPIMVSDQVQTPLASDSESNYDKASEKLKNEMTANESQPYVQVVGQYLLTHLEANPDHAGQILAEDKTILKSLDVMNRYAQKKRVGNVAVLTDEEGFAVVLQYFGCWDGEPIELPPEPPRYEPPKTPTRTMNSATSSTKSKRSTTTDSKNSEIQQLSLF
jgi:hypothetical protein